jgi:hypothetical protein
MKKAKIMDLTLDPDGKVTFVTALLAVLRSKAVTCEEDLLEIEEMRTKTKLEKKRQPGLNFVQTLAIMKLQKKWKAIQAKKKAQEMLDRRRTIRASKSSLGPFYLDSEEKKKAVGRQLNTSMSMPRPPG